MLGAIQNEMFGSICELRKISELEVWSVLGYELVSRNLTKMLRGGFADNWRVNSFSTAPGSNMCLVRSDCPDKPMASEIELADDGFIHTPFGTVHHISKCLRFMVNVLNSSSSTIPPSPHLMFYIVLFCDLDVLWDWGIC